MNANQTIAGGSVGYVFTGGQIAQPEPTRPLPSAIENLHHVVNDLQGAVSLLMRRLENLVPGGISSGAVGVKVPEPARAVRSHLCDQLCNASDALVALANEVRNVTERIEV